MTKASILVVDKPKGITSHDVVSLIKRLTNTTKVGHTGTLDPMATGVLVVCLGRATRISSYLQNQDKAYIANVKFGISTDTYDADGKVTERAPCIINREDLENILPAFTGMIQQMPPMISAISINGERLYKLARRGIEIERPMREVKVSKIKTVAFEPGDFPEAILEITCSKGTYVRALCYDIGKALGCDAHLSGLRRTRNGNYDISQAYSLEQIETAISAGELQKIMIPVDNVLAFLPYISVDEGFMGWIKNGRHITAGDLGIQYLPSGTFRVKCRDELLALYCRDNDEHRARPEVVF